MIRKFSAYATPPKSDRCYSFFDFDGTLTTGDSFTGFIRHCFGLGGLLRVLMKSAPAILLWKCGLRSNVYAKLHMFRAAFHGMPVDEFRRHGRTYISGIDEMLRADIVAQLQQAVASGETVAIVSASLGDWIRPWAAACGVQYVVATEPELDADHRLTGAFSTPNCEKQEKVRRILQQFPELDRNRDGFFVTAYGDSSSDIPMLRFADRPVKINH